MLGEKSPPGAFKAYSRPDLEIAYLRTSSGYEVDFILGDRELALEVKGSKRVHEGDGRGLRALKEDGPVKHAVIVSLEEMPRRLDSGIEVVPFSDTGSTNITDMRSRGSNL